MRCSGCGNTIADNIVCCPFCGKDIRIQSVLRHIQHEVTAVKREAGNVSDHLGRLEARFSELEALFGIPGQQKEQPVPVSETAEKHHPNAETLKAEREAGPTSPGEESRGGAAKAGPVKSPAQPPPLPPRRSMTISERLSKAKGSEANLGQKWLLIAGVLFTVLAVGYFLKYSFDQNWIGPAGRVAMAFLAGLAFLGGGEYARRRHYEIFGLYLIGGGIAMLYFSIYAGFDIYKLMPQAVAFGLMVMITALAGGLSLVYDVKWLAVLGLVGGFLTPVVLSTGVDNQMILMTYITILNAGILAIAFFKQWVLLNKLGFFFTWGVFAGWYVSHYSLSKFWVTLFFLNVFFLVYAVVPFAYHLAQRHTTRMKGLGQIVFNSFIAFSFSFIMIEEYASVEYVSLVTLIYAGIFFFLAHYSRQRDKTQLPAFVMLLAKGMLFLVLTVPILFSKQWITFFWAIQAVVLLWAAVKLQNRWLYFSFVALLAFAMGKFFLYDYDEVFRLQLWDMYFKRGYPWLFWGRMVTTLIMLGSLVFAARLKLRYPSEPSLFGKHDGRIIAGISLIALFAVLNFEVGGWFHDYVYAARFAAISVLWTLFSVSMMIAGFIRRQTVFRQCSLGLFGLTMFKVFFVDMAKVSTPYRIVSFMVLGIVLIGASYLYHRYKDEILPPQTGERPL